MKVYVVRFSQDWCLEGVSGTSGVFSTKEKAEEYIETKPKSDQSDYDIEEFEVDSPDN